MRDSVHFQRPVVSELRLRTHMAGPREELALIDARVRPVIFLG